MRAEHPRRRVRAMPSPPADWGEGVLTLEICVFRKPFCLKTLKEAFLGVRFESQVFQTAGAFQKQIMWADFSRPSRIAWKGNQRRGNSTRCCPPAQGIPCGLNGAPSAFQATLHGQGAILDCLRLVFADTCLLAYTCLTGMHRNSFGKKPLV